MLLIGEMEVFVLQSSHMYSIPFYKRPWFYILIWLVVLLSFYGWQVYTTPADHQVGILDVLFDLLCVFPIVLIFWMGFFAQFVLPVRSLEDRRKIFDRLRTDLFGGHGPAMFIRNGEVIKREGEEKKKGPGVLWLDSASAAVTRTAVKIKQTLGPGVHFIDNKEYIAGTVDLHIQSQTIEVENPFGDQEDDSFENGYTTTQNRRKMVSALTRDGIEVVPTISISFRVDTGFPKDGEPGSRFGYRTGITKKGRENEEKDKESIRRAILGEGVNPNMIEPSQRRVAWNELPASLAVDVWREYASKFTLDELFKPDQEVPSPQPEPPQPTDEEIDPLSQPVLVNSDKTTLQDKLAVLLREINLILSRLLRWLEGTPKEAAKTSPTPNEIIRIQPPGKHEPVMKTGLQVINEMVNARLKKPEVKILDDHGGRGHGVIHSPEHHILKNRGIKVLSVNIGNLRFDPAIEDEIITRWSASWLNNARAEKEQIERRHNIIKSSGQEKAIRQYADLLCSDLIRKKPFGVNETLKTLIMRTRTIIINNDQLRKDMSEEQQMLEDILRWIEVME